MSTIASFKRLLTPITARIRRMIAGAVIVAVKDDTDLQQMMIKTLARGVYDNVEVFGQYGFAYNPPTGLDAIAIERNGKYIVIAVGDRKYRIKKLSSGDVAIYDNRGQVVRFAATGITMMDKNGNNISMASGGITINGVLITQEGVVTTPKTLTTGGNITSGGDVITKKGVTLDTHKHPVTKATAVVSTGTATTPALTAETDAPIV